MRRAIVVMSFVACACADTLQVMTVNGPFDADDLGFTLPHEHVLVDFIGADSVGAHRYDQDSAFKVILPHLLAFKNSGGKTMMECTPSYLGRDPILLQRLSKATGINIVTNTGYYGARQEKFYPSFSFTEPAEAIAARWIKEWNEGIDGTRVRPGFMKLGADKGPLTETQRKVVEASAIAHLATGLPIGIHCGDGQPAQEALSILVSLGVSPSSFIWIHAQNEQIPSLHRELAKMGAWIEFDGLNETNLDQYISFLNFAKANNFLNKVLVSHDAGWYHVGAPGGGEFRGYQTLKVKLIPALQQAGFTADEINLITSKNPAEAFSIRKSAR